MFVSPQLSTGSPAAITTIIGGEVAVVSFAAACCFFDLSMLSRALPCCRGSLAGRLSGGAELQGGDHSGCGGAPAQQLSWGGSGRPLARLRRLWRRSAARQSCALCRLQLPKKNVRMSDRFARIPACLSARKHACRTPEARATRRYAARVLGPRTQNSPLSPLTIAKTKSLRTDTRIMRS